VEQRRVLEISAEELSLPIVNGIYADGSLEAARLAKMAEQGGASALLVFPPGIYTFGQRPEMALEHFRRIADATDLPLILFQLQPALAGVNFSVPCCVATLRPSPIAFTTCRQKPSSAIASASRRYGPIRCCCYRL